MSECSTSETEKMYYEGEVDIALETGRIAINRIKQTEEELRILKYCVEKSRENAEYYALLSIGLKGHVVQMGDGSRFIVENIQFMGIEKDDLPTQADWRRRIFLHGQRITKRNTISNAVRPNCSCPLAGTRDLGPYVPPAAERRKENDH